jgi:acyl carrier protein
MNEIEQQIADVLSDQFKVEPSLIDSDVTFRALRFDSLVLIELGLVLENELGITIEDGALRDEMTIGQAAALVASRGARL